MNKKYIDWQIKTINDHLTYPGWKWKGNGIDTAIGNLSPQVISDNWDRFHEDLMPYLSSNHTSWMFAVCWAFPPCPEDLGDPAPDSFDPNIPLKKTVRWAPHDVMRDRGYRI
jgi:hypothetical protein